MTKKICGTCKWLIDLYDKDVRELIIPSEDKNMLCCDNVDSDYYDQWIHEDYTCEEWKER